MSPTAPVGVPTVLNSLISDLDAINCDLVERICTSEYAYAESTQLGLQELTAISRDNLETLISCLADPTGQIDHSTAAATGRLKADRSIPLPALLHAYRLAGGLIAEGAADRSGPDETDILVALGARTWAVVDELSVAAANSYSDALAELSAADVESRQAMLRALLWGEVRDPASRRENLRALRLTDGPLFVVIAVESAEPVDSETDRRERTLLSRGVASRWISESKAELGLAVLRSPRDTARLLAGLEAGRTARIGVSVFFEDLENAPQAVREAELAMRCAEPGRHSVIRYGERPTALLLARSPEAARETALSILGPVYELPDGDKESLLETLWLWFESGGSAAAAGEIQHLHRNTIHQRLRRLERLTGRSCSDPVAASELHLALLALRLGHL